MVSPRPRIDLDAFAPCMGLIGRLDGGGRGRLIRERLGGDGEHLGSPISDCVGAERAGEGRAKTW